jgi:hypothetical protein
MLVGPSWARFRRFLHHEVQRTRNGPVYVHLAKSPNRIICAIRPRSRAMTTSGLAGGRNDRLARRARARRKTRKTRTLRQ